MPSNYEKLSKPSAPRLDTYDLAAPEKAALSTVTTVSQSPRPSNVSTPRSDRNNPFDTDLEGMIRTNTSDACMHKSNTQNSKKNDCQVWPGKDHWQQRAKAQKARNRCACMNKFNKLSRRNRIIVKVVVGVLIVGAAVGVGFGISKPLNAPIWGDKNHN
ncbi:hypothetical protein G7046_g3130 [Stylonectria norvegica]|nr:hypothetical protein G7046_g3130 [Stylonectria norvegica]